MKNYENVIIEIILFSQYDIVRMSSANDDDDVIIEMPDFD